MLGSEHSIQKNSDSLNHLCRPQASPCSLLCILILLDGQIVRDRVHLPSTRSRLRAVPSSHPCENCETGLHFACLVDLPDSLLVRFKSGQSVRDRLHLPSTRSRLRAVPSSHPCENCGTGLHFACLVDPPDFPQIRFKQSRCQRCGASCVPHMLLTNLPFLSSPNVCRSFAGRRT